MRVLLTDYETYSDVSIKGGVYRYVTTEEFAPLLMAYQWLDLLTGERTECKVHDFVAAGSHDLPAEVEEWIQEGGIVCGWSNFERVVTNRIRGTELPPEQYMDAMIWSAEAGYPMGLANAGTALKCGVQKDPIGKAAIKKFCMPYGRGKKARRMLPEDDPELWAGFVHYCRIDVELTGDILMKLPPMTGAEWALWQLDMKINDRGIRIDVDACITLRNLATLIKARLNELLVEATDGAIETVGQVAKIAEWCGTTSAGEPALSAALREGILNESQQRVAKLRIAGAKSSTAKIDAMMASIDPEDHRSRGTLQFCGTKTKRLAGRIWQPHNLPRTSFKPEEFEQCLALAKECDVKAFSQHYKPLEAVSMMLRGLIIPAEGHEFIISDYAAIEARVLAWYAGQEDILQLYREGGDVYKEMASAVYGKPLAQINDGERFVGKTLVLGSGYGLGWVRLQMDLNAKQVPTSEEEARQYTAGYRRRFSKVTIWWQTIIGLFRWVLDGNDPALNSAGRKRQPLRGGMTFGLEGKNDVYIELGTGNRIWYRDCKVEIKPAPWNIDEEIEVITARNTNSDSSRYDVTHSILAENICSATAREIMSRGMLRCEQAGYPVILSVHDEVVLEVEKGYGSLDDVDTLLCQPLFFCEDLPLATESIRSPRYRK